MSDKTVSFTFNNGVITCENKSIDPNKGDQVTFIMSNDSPTPLNKTNTIKDWGLYFNNPFSLENEKKYSFGNVSQQGVLKVASGINEGEVPAYSSYLVYIENADERYYTLDPQIIVSGGEVND